MTQPAAESSPDYGFDAMPDDEFMRRWTEFGDQFAAQKDKLNAFSQEHQRRIQVAALQNTLGELTAEQKEATIAAIRMMPDAVESEEAVGTSDVPVPSVPEGSDQ